MNGCHLVVKITKDGLKLNNHYSKSNYAFKDQLRNKMCTVKKTNGQLVLFVRNTVDFLRLLLSEHKANETKDNKMARAFLRS